MTQANNRNLIVMQSGGCTPVMNRSLQGVIDEAISSKAFDKVYGSIQGIEGLLEGRILDLGNQSSYLLKRIGRTPGAALGSTRRRLRNDDLSQLLTIFSKYEIGYFVMIGGNDSAETGHMIYLECRSAGYDLAVINVPKTIDNDLVLMDHTPGFGSAARFVALATMGAGRDAEAMGIASPITLIEVMGRDAGWLPAASALAKRDDRDAPHIICIPEVPVNTKSFLDNVEDNYMRNGFVVAVVGENVRSTYGQFGLDDHAVHTDDFGHEYYNGAGHYLSSIISRHLKVRVRYEKPGTIQRSLVTCISTTDAKEAEAAGRAAIQYMIEGHSDKIVTIERRSVSPYASSFELAPLDLVAGRVRNLPRNFFDSNANMATQAFINYAKPLIGPLPRFGRLD